MNKTKNVEKCINRIKKKFEKNHNIFLGEEDIRCHLFSELLRKFKKLKAKTIDKKKTIPLHAQISFLDNNRRLKEGKKPDITIIDISTLHLYSDGSIPKKNQLNKHFEFGRASIGIEIKLNWIKKRKGMTTEINKAIEKIEELKENNPMVSFYLIYFDKIGNLEDKDIKELNKGCEYLKIIYGKGNENA